MPTTNGHARTYAEPPGFRHEAVFYSGQRRFAERLLGFLREGVAQEEPALVVVSPEKIALLREALGEDAARVSFQDMTQVGANPARIIPAWTEFVREAGAAGRPLRGIGEPISAERSHAELFECHRHESLLNLAFAHAPDFRLLCPYDTTALDPAVVAHARCTHPLVHDEHGGVCASTAFHGVEAASEPCRAPLPPAPPEAQRLAILPATLTSTRAAVARRAERAGLTPRRRDDLMLAVNELATNSILHGGGAGTLTVWETSGALVCEVTDAGRLEHPLAGREPPEPGQIGRYGLWLVNQLCDLTEQRTHAHGNVVRVWMRRG
jgi:anti-sigma regulatory factor (Ser/Thr protein kinase)